MMRYFLNNNPYLYEFLILSFTTVTSEDHKHISCPSITSALQILFQMLSHFVLILQEKVNHKHSSGQEGQSDKHFSYFSMKTYVMGTHLKCLNEALLMSIHIICFHGEIISLYSQPVILNSKGLTETLRDIRTSTCQSWESEENNKLNSHI